MTSKWPLDVGSWNTNLAYAKLTYLRLGMIHNFVNQLFFRVIEEFSYLVHKLSVILTAVKNWVKKNIEAEPYNCTHMLVIF